MMDEMDGMNNTASRVGGQALDFDEAGVEGCAAADIGESF